jgi:protein-tyrosine-phosphatase
MKKTFRILFVCAGNTCRSPLAEALMKRELTERHLRGISVSSAGVSATEGLPAAGNSNEVARELGVSLSRFRSRPLTARRVALADLILTMERQHGEGIVERWPRADGKIHLISEFSGSGRRGIFDPVGKPLQVYRECGLVIQDEIKRIVPKVRTLVSGRRKK